MPELPRVVGYPFWVRRREPHPFGKGKRMECVDCGSEIIHRQNPEGPEVWCEPGGVNYGCLQRAFDGWDGLPTDFGDEPAAPYPPHRPEMARR